MPFAAVSVSELSVSVSKTPSDTYSESVTLTEPKSEPIPQRESVTIPKFESISECESVSECQPFLGRAIKREERTYR